MKEKNGFYKPFEKFSDANMDLVLMIDNMIESSERSMERLASCISISINNFPEKKKDLIITLLANLDDVNREINCPN